MGGRGSGSRPGERRGGRKVGTPNSVPSRAELTATAAELALPHVPLAFKTLIEIARKGQSEAARVSAASQILDRAYGRAAQVVAGDPNKPINVDVRHAIVELVRVIGKDNGR